MTQKMNDEIEADGTTEIKISFEDSHTLFTKKQLWDSLLASTAKLKDYEKLIKAQHLQIKSMGRQCLNTGMYGPLGLSPGQCDCSSCDANRILKLHKQIMGEDQADDKEK